MHDCEQQKSDCNCKGNSTVEYHKKQNKRKTKRVENFCGTEHENQQQQQQQQLQLTQWWFLMMQRTIYNFQTFQQAQAINNNINNSNNNAEITNTTTNSTTTTANTTTTYDFNGQSLINLQESVISRMSIASSSSLLQQISTSSAPHSALSQSSPLTVSDQTTNFCNINNVYLMRKRSSSGVKRTRMC